MIWSEEQTDMEKWIREAKNGTDTDELLQTRTDGHQRIWQNVEKVPSDWEDVEHCCTSTQEEIRYEGSPAIAPPLSRRRKTPPTPVRNSNDAFEEEQERFLVVTRFGVCVTERSLQGTKQ